MVYLLGTRQSSLIIITHEKNTKTSTYSTYSYYNSSSQLIRGMYIDNNLFTVSNDEIRVNDLETMKEIDKINVQTGTKNEVNTNTTTNTTKNTNTNTITNTNTNTVTNKNTIDNSDMNDIP